MTPRMCFLNRGSAAMSLFGAPFESTEDGLKEAFIWGEVNQCLNSQQMANSTHSNLMPPNKLQATLIVFFRVLYSSIFQKFDKLVCLLASFIEDTLSSRER